MMFSKCQGFQCKVLFRKCICSFEECGIGYISWYGDLEKYVPDETTVCLVVVLYGVKFCSACSSGMGETQINALVVLLPVVDVV